MKEIWKVLPPLFLPTWNSGRSIVSHIYRNNNARKKRRKKGGWARKDSEKGTSAQVGVSRGDPSDALATTGVPLHNTHLPFVSATISFFVSFFSGKCRCPSAY